MRKWKSRIRLRHLMTEEEDHESVQNSMNEIADALETSGLFHEFFRLAEFRNIPPGDDFFEPVDYANKLLGTMWDYADYEGIWVEL